MKTFITFVLLSLFTVFYIGLIPAVFANSEFQKISVGNNQPYGIIKAPPLNLQNILEKWKLLQVIRFDQKMLTLVMGSPFIEWTDEMIDAANYQAIPEGTITAAVSIVLEIVKTNDIHMQQFVFINKFGAIELYMRDSKTGLFVRKPHMQQKLI